MGHEARARHAFTRRLARTSPRDWPHFAQPQGIVFPRLGVGVHETGATPKRRPTRKHTVVPLLQSVQTLRFELFHRAALLIRPGGVSRLRMTDNPATRQTFTGIANALASG